jgi:hypothetical protein
MASIVAHLYGSDRMFADGLVRVTADEACIRGPWCPCNPWLDLSVVSIRSERGKAGGPKSPGRAGNRYAAIETGLSLFPRGDEARLAC